MNQKLLKMDPLEKRVQECIDACNDCVTAAKICLNQHIGEHDMKRCLQLCLDCIDISTACTHLLAAQSFHANELCRICAELCSSCENECKKFDSEVCRQCADACRKCAEKCEEITVPV